jgi:hypothetical protein
MAILTSRFKDGNTAMRLAIQGKPATGMTRSWRTVLCAAALAGGLAACGSDDDTGGSVPTASPSVSATAPCPAGSWRSTQVSASGSAAGVNLTAEGGSGVAVTIAADGAVTADFGQMQPIVYTGQAGGAQVKGEFLYRGTVSGTVSLPSPGATTTTPAMPTSTATSTPAAGTTTTAMPTATAPGTTSGAWLPTGTVNFGDLSLTVRLIEPVAVTIVDNVKIKDVTGDQTTQAGNAVDLQPLLRAGEYRCDGNTLVITPSDRGPTVTWTLQRA